LFLCLIRKNGGFYVIKKWDKIVRVLFLVERMKIVKITGHTVEKIEDPFGILSGERYEFYLNIEVPEDDELYSEKGLRLRVLFVIDERGANISHYHILENTTEQVLDFELEDEEEQLVEAYCKEHTNNVEE
jgi:hypothetical protein